MRFVKIIIAIVIISLLWACFFCVGSAFMNVDAEEITEPETTEDSYDPETDINYIKYIDISLIPGSITSGEDVSVLVKITYDREYNPNEKNEKLTWYIDGTSSSGKAYVSIVSYDTLGNANVLIAGTAQGSCTIIFLGSYHERTDAFSTAKVSSTIVVEPYETFVSTIKGILSSRTILILVLTVAVTVVGKTSIKIFRFGVNYKSNFATVDQQEIFEQNIRKELRESKTEIQDNILKVCLREINRETRPLRDLQTMASNIERDREILNVRLDSIDQKYNEIKKVAENINQLEIKVNRLQYGETSSDVRRSGK